MKGSVIVCRVSGLVSASFIELIKKLERFQIHFSSMLLSAPLADLFSVGCLKKSPIVQPTISQKHYLKR